MPSAVAGQCERRFEFTGVFVDHRAILMALPSVVESNSKSIAHTMFGASASIGGTEGTPGRFRADRVLTCRPSWRQNMPELTTPIRRVVNYRLIAAAHPQVLIIAWNWLY